ncbi:EthD domain-containing protein [Hymenobacter negativus]|nr:EthD domain-containing protein [Hymenobacter negativus]
MLITLKRRVGMSQQEFKDYRRDVHEPLLLAIPEA